MNFAHQAKPRLLALIVASLCVGAIALPSTASASPAFQSQGMWIWYVSQAEGGNVAKIAARAKRFGVKTVFVKSSDGSSWWKQFDEYVGPLKAAGLRVCSWQYIYGRYPVAEANLGARAVAAGADCHVINAEVEYKTRYTAAQQYITQLRAQIGSSYPVGFTSFAYPDFHPTVPYSVFLGPGGAQWNLPQMYFKAFGSKIPAVFNKTFSLNQIYQREIHPLGQTYQGVRYKSVIEFRKYAKRYRAKGLSWWSWNNTRTDAWKGIRRRLGRAGAKPATPYPVLRQGGKGDLVRWGKLKLNASGAVLTVNSTFDKAMADAIRAFQQQRGLPVTGQLDLATWPVLQEVKLPSV